MDVKLPDGTVIQGVPDGMSKADLVAKLKANGHDVSGLEDPPPAGPMDRLKAQTNAVGGELQNLTLGAVRGAGSIGATLLAPVDAGARALGIQNDYIGRTDRRQAMTDALQTLGADPNSSAFKTGKLGGEIAGTAGAGGVIGNALARPLGAIAPEVGPQIVNALRTNGFTTGAAPAATRAAAAGNLALRSGAGAVAGGAQVGLADPDHAGTAAMIGGALPGAAQVAGVAGRAIGDGARSVAEDLVASALKAPAKAKRTGEEATAIRTLLDEGINVTKGGVNKLKTKIDDLNNQIADKIGASDATIDPAEVVNALSSSRAKFGTQVNPSNDLNAINSAQEDFLNTVGAGPMPIGLAQKVKQGTYRVLSGKYGEQGSASTEAQKDLARGLKDQIATAIPEIGPLNAKESDLLSTLSVTERRVLQQANNNPMGLAALALHEPTAFAAFMADKSALFKSLVARSLNKLGNLSSSEPLNQLAGPAAYRAIPSTARK